MSSADRRPALAAVLLALVAGLSACTAPADADTSPATGAASDARPADDTTRQLAEVEFARQCAIAGTAFADEADITTDLDTRLIAAGFSHEEWKNWHDALVDSPELVEQFAEISERGCP